MNDERRLSTADFIRLRNQLNAALVNRQIYSTKQLANVYKLVQHPHLKRVYGADIETLRKEIEKRDINALSPTAKEYLGYGKNNIQAILFKVDSTKYNTSKKRLDFIRKLGLNPIKKMHKTDNYNRYRIIEPTKDMKMRAKKLNDDISFIFYFID